MRNQGLGRARLVGNRSSPGDQRTGLCSGAKWQYPSQARHLSRDLRAQGPACIPPSPRVFRSPGASVGLMRVGPSKERSDTMAVASVASPVPARRRVAFVGGLHVGVETVFNNVSEAA